jgi:hypothetical protein
MASDLAESSVDGGKGLEALPDNVGASLEARDARRQEMASASPVGVADRRGAPRVAMEVPLPHCPAGDERRPHADGRRGAGPTRWRLDRGKHSASPVVGPPGCPTARAHDPPAQFALGGDTPRRALRALATSQRLRKAGEKWQTGMSSWQRFEGRSVIA